MERGDPDWLVWNTEPSNWSVKKMKSPDWPVLRKEPQIGQIEVWTYRLVTLKLGVVEIQRGSSIGQLGRRAS